MFLDEFFEWDGHFFLDGARIVDVSGNAEEFGACIALAAEAVEPASSTPDDSRGHGNRLDIGNGGGAAEQTDGGRERWLQAWLTRLTLEGFDQRSLFATNVRAHAAMDVDVEVITRTTSVFADQAFLVGLLDSALENGGLMVKFPTNVYISGTAIHGAASDKAAFDQLVWVFAHNFAVLAGTRFTFVGVDDKIAGLRVFIPIFEVHERLQIRRQQRD